MLFECSHFGPVSIIAWNNCHMHRVSSSMHASCMCRLLLKKHSYSFGSFTNKTMWDKIAVGRDVSYQNGYIFGGKSSRPSLLQVQGCGTIYPIIYHRTSTMDDSNGSRKHFYKDQLTTAYWDCLFLS